MSLFDIDYDKLVRLLLPVRMRRVLVVAWLWALLSPLRRLYSLFLSNRSRNIYDLSHNSQVVYIQSELNDLFDTEERRIVIEDDEIRPAVYLYIRPENEPVYLYTPSESEPVYLYTPTEVSTSGSFKVLVPAAVTFDMDGMKAVINRRKLPGMKYQIIIV